jgi:hypothetical protein
MKTITMLCILLAACAESPPEDEPTSIEGTWRWQPNVFHGEISPEYREEVTFREDLTYEWTSPDGSSEGTYTFEDRRLTFASSEGWTTELEVLLLPDRMLFPAYRPAGLVHDAVGIWQTIGVYSGDEIWLRLVLYEGGRYEYNISDGESSWGTWRELGEAIELTSDFGQTAVFHRIGERAIGSWLFERLE